MNSEQITAHSVAAQSVRMDQQHNGEAEAWIWKECRIHNSVYTLKANKDEDATPPFTRVPSL